MEGGRGDRKPGAGSLKCRHPRPGVKGVDQHHLLQTSQPARLHRSPGEHQAELCSSVPHSDMGAQAQKRDLGWCPLAATVRFMCVLLFVFSKDKGKRWRRQFSVVCGCDLRLWLWLVGILKYFRGRTPSPELPLGINVFSKMKTVNKDAERSFCREPGWSRQDGVIHLLHGVRLAGQLLQGPSVAFIQCLQAGHIQDIGE